MSVRTELEPFWAQVRPAAGALSAALGLFRASAPPAVLVEPCRDLLAALAAAGVPPVGLERLWTNAMGAVATLADAARGEDRREVQFALRWLVIALNDLAAD